MMCQWDAFLNIVPRRLRYSVDKLGKGTLQELRLRIGTAPVLVFQDNKIWLEDSVTYDDLSFCINTASEYSPWAANTASDGYVTAPGGQRVGICGTAAVNEGNITSIRTPSSLCLRVARDFSGIADDPRCYTGSLLIIGRPGSGKTTLLRDLIRLRSDRFNECVCVIDERGEIFPRTNRGFCFPTGRNTDVLTGCSKSSGILMTLRCMNPDIIAIDEITQRNDCDALLHAGWCGVKLIATAHAGNMEDLYRRPVYKPVVESGLFDAAIVLHSDKSWNLERIHICN